MRHYQPIWDKLKKLPIKEATITGISISVDERFHARYVKAVKKEKYNDAEFKLNLNDRRSTLTHACRGKIITFFLKRSIGIEDI